MALAVTHILIAIIILDLFRHYVFGKGKFPRYLLVIGGIAGLAPDLDIPLSWFVSLITGNTVQLHGEFTHSIFFVILFAVIGLIRHLQEDDKWAKIFYVIAAGWFIHLLLDCIFGGYGTFLWPVVYNTKMFCPQWNVSQFRVAIDAALLVIWLIHEEIHNRIRDYI